ncbi:efflux RND transporter permease subunit [Aestuariirhabdus litorea]|uniref:Efflux RND transporter permease subunit n=1 Tax=Aestuariirhabdus litorea TaxID=2528527 RepID=A0A3P3VIW4_9GAMM|nr:efflux RND transporter permease subunit [Aestuariirhabdus litorea]RRJ82650.1 efflux RND transporter permease subunit [Aestuariirhabdus litorea]RWW92811.1 CusA/CzcA family heavy metal efflux RND transporter [Endozoicomonadaceae bacterium GTF-13]
MINGVINGSLRNRFLVLIATALLIAAGIWAVKKTPLDAIPDLSDVQVIVFTEFPGQAPQVVEDQVTYPLTTAMLGVPYAKVVRGYSFFGYSFVYIIFEDGTDMYWARSRVLEQLNYAASRLPDTVQPVLGPDATGVGWVYEYALVDRSGRHDLSELRSIQDWYLRYQLQTVPGVSEVASIGGHIKQYQVEVDPHLMARYKVPLSRVKAAIKRSNNDVGGRLVEMAETEYMVRGLGYIRTLSDLEEIPLGSTPEGTPLRLKDIAHVQLGPELRRGVAELDGEGETVGGIIVMRYGENAQATIKAVKEKLEQLKPGLPEGVEIIPVYDRGDLIQRAVDNLSFKLIEESIVVSIVCILFLLHVRSALVAIITLPIGILMAFMVMQWQGINANIMSLGGIAIAIGAMVDGAIVMIENAHKHLEQAHDRLQRELTDNERWMTIADSAREVGPALFFSLLIITVSFLPVFTLQAQEGRMFGPLAFTKTYAMAAAAILSVTLIPVLMGYLIRGKILPESRNPVNRVLHWLHAPLLGAAIRWRWITIVLASLVVVVTAYPISKLGTEFMPPLDEGDILYMPTTYPGVSITKVKELLQQTDKILASFPEVERVFGKAGRADTATDPAPLSMLETTIKLKPKELWPDPDKTTQELMNEMDQAIKFPGLANAWTMPIKTRIDMLSTGIKTPVGIKVSGPSLAKLEEMVLEIEQVVRGVSGTLTAFGDRAVGGYYLDFTINRTEAARYGLTTGEVQEVIQTAIGGMNVTRTVEGLERYPVNIRYPRELRDDIDSLKRVLVPTPGGAQIPLTQLAELELRRGPPGIKSEDARLSSWIYVDIYVSDIGGYVREAKKAVSEQVTVPPGYTISWSGQYEYMERAAERLKIVIPATLMIIFLLLYLNFRNISAPLVVMLSIPFGLVGGIWLVHWLGFNLSVAVAVGFIALAGVAAEIGVLVLTFIDQAVAAKRRSKGATGARLTSGELRRAVLEGTSERVRPIAMTSVTVIAGLLPIMWSSGSGSGVMQRIAAPMIGGMISVTLLCLVVLPVIYGLVLQLKERRRKAHDPIQEAAEGHTDTTP